MEPIKDEDEYSYTCFLCGKYKRFDKSEVTSDDFVTQQYLKHRREIH